MAKRREGSLRGKGVSIFFGDDDDEREIPRRKSRKKDDGILEIQTAEISKFQKSEIPPGDGRADPPFNFQTSKRLKERKRSRRKWQRTIYLTDEEESTLLKIKSRLFEKGVDAEYSEIVGKAILYFFREFEKEI